MTSLHLLLWIVSGIVLQVAIYLGIGFFYRHWYEYQALRSRAVEFNLPVKAPVVTADDALATASWPGFRRVRVERQVAEDVARSVCSFYLMPEEGQVLLPFLPGQFLTFRLDVGVANSSPVSDAPRPDSYRVSIKRVLPPEGCRQPLPGARTRWTFSYRS